MGSRPAINLNWRVASVCAVTVVSILWTSCKIYRRAPPFPKKNVAKLQMAELGGSLQLFYQDCGRYPTSREGLEALVRNPGLGSWRGPYLNRGIVPKDPWKRDYVYRCPGQ